MSDLDNIDKEIKNIDKILQDLNNIMNTGQLEKKNLLPTREEIEKFICIIFILKIFFSLIDPELETLKFLDDLFDEVNEKKLKIK